MNFESIKIEGKKYLDKNDYDKLLIDLASDVRRVKFFGKNTYPTTSLKHKVSDDIFKYDSYKVDKNIQDEVILQVIDHFLDYTTINEIKYNQKVDRYNGRWDLIESPYRTLMFRPNGFISNDINKKIMESYYNNRAKYCFNKENKIKSIGVSTNSTSYGEEITILVGKDRSISEIDQEFLTNLIEDRLDLNHYADICYSSRRVNQFYEEYAYISCGDTKIEIKDPLDMFVRDAIVIHNRELEESKNKQLVLRGVLL